MFPSSKFRMYIRKRTELLISRAGQSGSCRWQWQESLSLNTVAPEKPIATKSGIIHRQRRKDMISLQQVSGVVDVSQSCWTIAIWNDRSADSIRWRCRKVYRQGLIVYSVLHKIMGPVPL